MALAHRSAPGEAFDLRCSRVRQTTEAGPEDPLGGIPKRSHTADPADVREGLMANPDHIEMLLNERRFDAIGQWRREHPVPEGLDLNRAGFSSPGRSLATARLWSADLRCADARGADFIGADLNNAD